MTKNKDQTNVTVRFPNKLHILLKKISKTEKRSLNNMVVYVIERWCAKYKKKQK